MESLIEEKEMSFFFLEVIRKVPNGSVWFICDFMDDVWCDFADFRAIRTFLIDSNPYKNDKIIGVKIGADFVSWYEDFIRDNYMFWGYLESHFIICNNEFSFRAIESNNLLVIDSLKIPESSIRKVLSLGIHIVVDSSIQ